MYFIQSKNTVSANGGPNSSMNMAGFVLHTEEKDQDVAVKRFPFSWLSVSQAILARLMLIGHNVIAVWRVTVVYQSPIYWVMLLTNILILGEGQHVLLKRNGIEFTWWCPAFFFYLTSTLPTVWLLQLNLQYNYIYSLSGPSSTSPYVHLKGMTDDTNMTVYTLSATINVTNVTVSTLTTTGPVRNIT
ncbi:hypothetical protein ACJMK2_033374 [Sinanodonta woodiana]|uniref:Uncharacterized protein n=1 Tax=Sinanodonta woodiana TaxID=1069815 RepID=A0ABD3WQ10_SINWO